MRLNVPAAEQQWACTTAVPAASPNLCYEATLPAGVSNGQKPRYSFAWYICFCLAQQAWKNIAQNEQVLVHLGNFI